MPKLANGSAKKNRITKSNQLDKEIMLKIENDMTIQSSMLIKYCLIAIVGVFFAFDLIGDLINEPNQITTYIEGLAFSLTLMLLIWQLKENISMNEQLDAIQDEKLKLSEDLNKQIETEFDHWKFTPSEKDIAWLIIKGFLIKEIAYSRSVSEKTVQGQLTSIYRKANVKNRSEFTTIFIQQLFADASTSS